MPDAAVATFPTVARHMSLLLLDSADQSDTVQPPGVFDAKRQSFVSELQQRSHSLILLPFEHFIRLF